MQLKNHNIVAIGGGHGLGRVMSSLSFLEGNLTGIVATTDNGGSTGKLRRRTSSIAWGDLRNCLTQLVDEESIGSKLFNFRFDGKDELKGHNIGNLIFYALNEIQSRPTESLNLIRHILRVKSTLLPMSEVPTDLMAFYDEGRIRVGEVSVDDMPAMPQSMMLAPLVKSTPEAIKAIKEASLVILGPGSFLTSVVPSLLVRDICKAIIESNAHCVFIDNLVAENSPAGHLNIDEKLNWLSKNIGCQPIDTVITGDEQAKSDLVHIMQQNLSSDGFEHYHDRDKLVNALELCLAEHVAS